MTPICGFAALLEGRTEKKNPKHWDQRELIHDITVVKMDAVAEKEGTKTQGTTERGSNSARAEFVCARVCMCVLEGVEAGIFAALPLFQYRTQTCLVRGGR